MSDSTDRVEARIASGEVYVMCNECGARLWSDDALPSETHDRDRSCPYKHDSALAEKMGCEDRNGSYWPIVGGHF